MKIEKTMELLNKYGTCPDCGSTTIGSAQGAIIIEEETFTRKCSCGFKATVDENDIATNVCDYCGCKLDEENKGSETTCKICFDIFESSFEGREENE